MPRTICYALLSPGGRAEAGFISSSGDVVANRVLP